MMREEKRKALRVWWTCKVCKANGLHTFFIDEYKPDQIFCDKCFAKDENYKIITPDLDTQEIELTIHIETCQRCGTEFNVSPSLQYTNIKYCRECSSLVEEEKENDAYNFLFTMLIGAEVVDTLGNEIEDDDNYRYFGGLVLKTKDGKTVNIESDDLEIYVDGKYLLRTAR